LWNNRRNYYFSSKKSQSVAFYYATDRIHTLILMDNYFQEIDSKINAIQAQLLKIQESLASTRQIFKPEDDIISIQEACTITHNAIGNMYILTSKSLIPHMKRGKRLYFSRTELINWIKEGKKKTIKEIDEETDQNLIKIRHEIQKKSKS